MIYLTILLLVGLIISGVLFYRGKKRKRLTSQMSQGPSTISQGYNREDIRRQMEIENDIANNSFNDPRIGRGIRSKAPKRINTFRLTNTRILGVGHKFREAMRLKRLAKNKLRVSN